jgi:small-conductance mechanosensitive channel
MEWLREVFSGIKIGSLDSLLHDALATLILGLLVLVVRRIAGRAISGSKLPLEMRRRLDSQARAVALLVFLALGVVIWAAELRTVALSLVAFAAAVVLALKEVIMCLSGAFVRGVSRHFKLGDRIEVGAVRGDVIDIGMLTTTIQEIGPGATIHQHTGRAVVLPNSIWLASPVANFSHLDEYCFHVVTIPCEQSADLAAIEAAMLSAAAEVCSEYLEEARSYLERMERRRSIDAPSADPRVWLRISSPKDVELLLRFPAPIRLVGKTEQKILRRFLAIAPPLNGQRSAPAAAAQG